MTTLFCGCSFLAPAPPEPPTCFVVQTACPEGWALVLSPVRMAEHLGLGETVARGHSFRPVPTCPQCGGTRIATDIDAVVTYTVRLGEDGEAELDAPAEVVDGAVQYELVGPMRSFYCDDPDCGYEQDRFDQFLPQGAGAEEEDPA